MNGLVLVSPGAGPRNRGSPDLSPIPWMLTLPSIVAANYERQGKLDEREHGGGDRLYARRSMRRTC